MPPKNISTKLNPVRLNSIPQLRVRATEKADPTPCSAVMSAMLTCWASSGQSSAACSLLEQQLRECMDTHKNTGTKRNSINYHLMRMYPKVVGPKKRKT
ncbi:mitochondrial 37S ribosomal protein mS37 [Aspergillus undulatus]|uniref:mitochondrial 37S ribosomal protein mS37 n=1 Tax=Aspergillus undulatus TaxID=1810928 RepID=UPI003CCE3F83